MLDFISNWWWLTAAIIISAIFILTRIRVRFNFNGYMGKWRWGIVITLVGVIISLITFPKSKSTNIDDWRPTVWQAMEKGELPGKRLVEYATKQDAKWHEAQKTEAGGKRD